MEQPRKENIMHRKHLVIEGPDGAGKDTLIAQLTEIRPDFQLHPRASTSLGGPTPALVQWVDEDLDRLERNLFPRPQIYNRHPLISEPIYWWHRGSEQPLISDEQRSYRVPVLSQYVTVILCLPGYHQVWSTLARQGRDAHMPGVYKNIHSIYEQYNRLVWPGPVVRYNYLIDKPLDLINTLNRMGVLS